MGCNQSELRVLDTALQREQKLARDLTSQVAALQRQLNQSQSMSQDLITQVAQKTNEVEGLQAQARELGESQLREVTGLNSRITELQRQLGQKALETKGLEKQIAEKDSEVEGLQKQNEVKDTEVEGLKSQALILEERNKKLQQEARRFVGVEVDRDNALSKVRTLEAENRRLLAAPASSKRDVPKPSVDGDQSSVSKLRNEVDHLRKELEDKDRLIAKWASLPPGETTSVTSEIVQGRKDANEALRQRVETLEKENASLKETINRLKGTIRKLNLEKEQFAELSTTQ